MFHYQRRKNQPSQPNLSTVTTLEALPVPPPNTYVVASPEAPPIPLQHSMVTHHWDGTSHPLIQTNGTIRYPLPQALLAQIPSSIDEPTCYTQVVRVPKWRQVITSEFNALLKNKTWVLVPSSPHQHVVCCKWVFKLKCKAYSSIE